MRGAEEKVGGSRNGGFSPLPPFLVAQSMPQGIVVRKRAPSPAHKRALQKTLP